MTTETSNARGEVVAWIRVKPDGSPDWAEDCIADDEHFLNPAMEADGYRLRPLIYADTPPPPAAARGDVRGLVEVPEGLCEPVQGTRFGHHPDPAIDFSVEVESLIAREFNARHGIGKPGSLPEPMWQVKAAIERAMQFRVGGDEGAKAAKASLRTLEAALAAEGVQAGEASDVPMTPERAAFFLRRFKADEKMLGPHEQQALDFAIEALSQQPEARGVVDGWALTRLRAHEARCDECGRAVWDGKDRGNCIGFLTPCGKRVRLEDCGTTDCLAALTGERNG